MPICLLALWHLKKAITLHAMNFYVYSEQLAWLKPPALRRSCAFASANDSSAQVMTGSSWSSGAQRTHTQPPSPGKHLQSFACRHRSLPEMPMGNPPCPLPQATGQHGPEAPSPQLRGQLAAHGSPARLLHWLLPAQSASVQAPQTQRAPFLSPALCPQPAHVRGLCTAVQGAPGQTHIAALVCEVADAFLGADRQLHRNNPA